MKSYDAYCAVCDANVRVTLDPAAEHPLAGAEVECLDRCPACDETVCPLEGASAEELSDRLEFVPHEKREPEDPAAVEADAEEVIRQGRIQAMRRGNDPVP